MIVILTGAGISAESGIRTYRTDTGLWEEHRIEDVATPEGFARDPDAVNAFYDERLDSCLSAAPNAAHIALARLERESRVPVTIITQNIDDLHERAGSRNVIHIHGRVGKPVCSRCRKALEGQRLVGCAPCPACGGGARADIVWFGETPMYLEEIAAAMSRVSIYMAVGTSGEVYPAAGFVKVAKKRKARRIEFNLTRTSVSNYFREDRRGPASQTVPAFVDALLREQALEVSL